MRKRRNKKTVVILSILLSLMLVLTACGGGNDTPPAEEPEEPAEEPAEEPSEEPEEEPEEESTGPVYGGEVNVYSPQDPDFLDPHKYVASGTEEIMLNVVEGLVKATPDGDVIPAVAEDYEISEDGLTYTFDLRDGIKFHNGEEVTVEDVKYSIERMAGIGAEEPLKVDFAVVEKVETPDEDTVVITLKNRDAAFLTYLYNAIIPKSNDGNHNDNPIGTGPFKFVEYLPEQRVVLEKFEDYWNEETPYLDKVTFSIMPDREAAVLAFRSGQLDIYPRIDHIHIEELSEEFRFPTGLENMVQLMGMNHEREPFNDLKVRQAINYAVDVDEIIEAVAYGYGVKLGSNFSPAMEVYYEEGLEDVYNQDIEKAKDLLAEAGYPDGFSTTVSVPSNYAFHVDTAQVIVSQLAEAGIDVEIELVEWGVWLERIYAGRDYDMTIIAFTGKLDPHKVLYRYQTDYQRNFFNYSNENYDQIIDDAIVETNQDTRIELYKEAQRILNEDAVAVYIMDREFNIGMPKNIQGERIYPIYFIDMEYMHFVE